jgi:hypothetical protein
MNEETMTRKEARSEAAMMILSSIVAIEANPRLQHDPEEMEMIDREIEIFREGLRKLAGFDLENCDDPFSI